MFHCGFFTLKGFEVDAKHNEIASVCGMAGNPHFIGRAPSTHACWPFAGQKAFPKPSESQLK